MSSTFQRPSPLACVQCRSKHLKCDAITPICSRCTERDLQCTYTPSRRGCGGRTKRHITRIQSPPTNQLPLPLPLPPTPSSDTPSLSVATTTSPARTWTDTSLDHSTTSAPPDMTPASVSISVRSEDDHLTNLYYSNFHPAHPILVPRCRYQHQNYPEHLKSVVKFIGSHYAPNISSDTLRSSTVETLMQTGDDPTPETVQTLLLYAIALHARYEPVEAMSVLTRAVTLAISLGMYTTDFAREKGRGDPVYAESLRRTWWELYVADGYLAALHRYTSFKTNAVRMSVLLPCEEAAYDNCTIPTQPFSLQQYDGRLFADEEIQFSSFTYRIDAVRILARVISVSSANEVHGDNIQAIDNAIASWKHHLPSDKSGIVDCSGVDQMMFQSYMFIQCSSIFLHFPRSELPITMPAAAEISCAKRHMEAVSPTSNQHAAKALAASKDLANLASLPVEKYSPMFICALVFACVVQLSACSAYGHATTEGNRDRVGLSIGVLKALSRQWSMAVFVSQQLKRAASEIFNPRTDLETTQSSSSAYDSGVDMSSFTADMSWFDIFYSDSMSGLQSHGTSTGSSAPM